MNLQKAPLVRLHHLWVVLDQMVEKEEKDHQAHHRHHSYKFPTMNSHSTSVYLSNQSYTYSWAPQKHSRDNWEQD